MLPVIAFRRLDQKDKSNPREANGMSLCELGGTKSRANVSNRNGSAMFRYCMYITHFPFTFLRVTFNLERS